MDVSGSLSLVQTVIDKLGSPIRKEIVAVLGVKSQLEKLKDTMFFINNVLLDAEEKERELRRLGHRNSHVERGRLERLREALYQADDLFDEVTTLADRKKLMMTGNKLSREVCLFFSRFNQLRCAFTYSHEIKTIREKLDDIVKDHQLAGNQSIVPHYGLVRNNETHSNLGQENDEIFGRDEDKRIVIDMLVDNSNVIENVTVVSIVGIGGLGKTALAQLVYNDDKKVKKEFPLKMWVCVSDDFNVKVLAAQILAAATKQSYQNDGLSMDRLQEKLREVLGRNKYLLVLDDVWNEIRGEWRRLKDLLVGGGEGSRILVTTRSKQVANVTESHHTLELKGLSDDDSWSLFQKVTSMQPQLHDIGKEIVGKCANVPLAIRVVGSLLRGQGKSKWENLKNRDFANIIQDETDGIVPVLKISYYYLPFHLKSCFTYCAVFPKDYKIIKEDLICLWMARGFVIPLDGESFENAGDRYFEQLLQRCFFQDVELAKGTNEIESCKMHDLIHDLAKEVAGTEILSCDYSTRCFNEKTHHVSFDQNIPNDFAVKLTEMERMRTFLRIDVRRFFSLESLGVEVSKMKYLRVLGLNHIEWEIFPSRIGELVHLRYLDLSYNRKLCVLSPSITKLYNLQTLKLCGCRRLERLPRELRKLINLRFLDLRGCNSLTHMPPGMKSMTSLQKLTMYVVNGRGNYSSTSVGQLKDLKVFRSGSLSSLRCLVIEECNELKSISAGRGVWEHFTALESLSLRCLPQLELEDEDDVGNNSSNGSREEGSNNNNNNNNNNKEGSSAAEMPWRYLAPTLRYLLLQSLPKVVKLPKGIECLSSLQSLEIWGCDNLKSLTPSIGCLSSLQSLQILRCPKLKTMPEEMRHLTSLTTLYMWRCSSKLEEECKNKNGANWSNIQHIPNLQT